MNTKSIDKMMDIRESRREKANERYEAKMEKAEALIGQLMREGQIVYYITKTTKRGLKVIEGDYFKIQAAAMRLV